MASKKQPFGSRVKAHGKKSTAYFLGVKEGQSSGSGNPYPSGTQEARDWMKGFQHGRAKKKQREQRKLERKA